MIDLKKFDKKKITKPAGELTPNDVGSLIKVIEINGCEVKDVMTAFTVGQWRRPRPDLPNDVIQIDLNHLKTFADEFRGRSSVYVRPGMRVVVQRPLPVN